MRRKTNKLPEARLQSHMDVREDARRYPVQVRATFIRLMRSQQVQATV